MATGWDTGSSTSSTTSSFDYGRLTFKDEYLFHIEAPIRKGEPKKEAVKQIFKFDPEELDI